MASRAIPVYPPHIPSARANTGTCHKSILRNDRHGRHVESGAAGWDMQSMRFGQKGKTRTHELAAMLFTRSDATVWLFTRLRIVCIKKLSALRRLSAQVFRVRFWLGCFKRMAWTVSLWIRQSILVLPLENHRRQQRIFWCDIWRIAGGFES